MKRLIILLLFLILFSPSIFAVRGSVHKIMNISFETGECSEVTRYVFSEVGTHTLSERQYFQSYGTKTHFIPDSVQVTSSEGPLNFSVVNELGVNKLYLMPFALYSYSGKPAFFDIYTNFERCFGFNWNWSLIRIPVISGNLDSPINFTLNLDRRLGHNNDGYIFLLGLPFIYTPYMDLSSVNILSEDPISVNFISKFRDNYNFLVSFADLYYYPLAKLKIEQEDTVDLEKEKIYRQSDALNKFSEPVFYYIGKDDKINIFYSLDNPLRSKSHQIDSSDGLKIFLSQKETELTVLKKACFPFSDKNLLFPFQCMNTEGGIDVSNYLNSGEDTLLVDFEYILKYKELDTLEVVSSNKCILFNEITIPPIQVIQDVKQPSLQFKLSTFNTSCVSQRIVIDHDNIARYISPALTNLKNNFIKKENSFQETNFSLNIPTSSVHINFNATLKNFLLPKIIFWLYLLIFTVLTFWTIYAASKKIKRNAENKLPLITLVFDFIFFVVLELVGILQFNPNRSVITLLTLTPAFGIIIGLLLYKLVESQYIRSKANIYKFVPQRFKQ